MESGETVPVAMGDAPYSLTSVRRLLYPKHGVQSQHRVDYLSILGERL